MAAWLPEEPHVPILECNVRYLGRSAPADVPDRIAAVQNALFSVYQPGIALAPLDTSLTVFTSGLIADSPGVQGAVDKWWPIRDLLECGAFRLTGDSSLPFEPITEAPRAKKKSTSSPVLFAMTFRRRDIPAVDTWVFACGTADVALALNSATLAVYNNRGGWASSPNDRPPGRPNQRQKDAPSIFQAQVRGRQRISEWDGAITSEGLTGKKQYLKDYYEKPELSGFFYTPASSLVQKFNVAELQFPDEEQVSENPQLTGEQGAPAGYSQQVDMEFPAEQYIDPMMSYGADQTYGFRPFDDAAGLMFLPQDYIDPAESHYETRIVAQPGIAYDPFADTGPYERNLPVAVTGFGDPRYSAW